MKILSAALVLIFSVSTTLAQDAGDLYEVTRNDDGSFSFTIHGIAINEGSTLRRESILLDDSSCPIQLGSFSTGIVYEDRQWLYECEMSAMTNAEIQAFKVVTIHYDVFGQHIRNYANTEVMDHNVGEFTSSPSWRALDSGVSEMLTTVTFVSRVRYSDGTQWVFDEGKLHAALSRLELERVAEDNPD